MLADTLLPFAHRGPARPGLPTGVLDAASEGVRARLYMRPCSDLRMCLTHRGRDSCIVLATS